MHPYRRASLSRGLSLMELLVVVAVAAILAAVAVPALMSIVPTSQLRGSARSVVSLMQQARLLAENTQKPARVVLDCRAPAGAPRCEARLYSAVFNPDATLNRWAQVPGAARTLAPRVTAAPRAGSVRTGFTPGAPANPDGLFWAVFMPSGRLRQPAGASHDPFRLVFSRPGAPRTWELAVSQESGRASLNHLQ